MACNLNKAFRPNGPQAERRFVQGEDYHSDETVRLLALDPDREFAKISGTEKRRSSA